ncbi:MAG TPA: hypothetical protein VNS88_05535, partial [Nitrospiraceae bacterium]|nr:hypothetical protein [Nitrospiraceae bacterium]
PITSYPKEFWTSCNRAHSNKQFAATGLFLNFYFYSSIILRLCLTSLFEFAMKAMNDVTDEAAR